MRRITHTQDSLKLAEFLDKYPSQWHSINTDKRTGRALARVIELWGSEHIEVRSYGGNVQSQVRFNPIAERRKSPRYEWAEGMLDTSKPITGALRLCRDRRTA